MTHTKGIILPSKCLHFTFSHICCIACIIHTHADCLGSVIWHRFTQIQKLSEENEEQYYGISAGSYPFCSSKPPGPALSLAISIFLNFSLFVAVSFSFTLLSQSLCSVNSLSSILYCQSQGSMVAIGKAPSIHCYSWAFLMRRSSICSS